jgi:hypothetical protein
LNVMQIEYRLARRREHNWKINVTCKIKLFETTRRPELKRQQDRNISLHYQFGGSPPNQKHKSKMFMQIIKWGGEDAPPHIWMKTYWEQGRTAPHCKQFTTGTSTEETTDLKKTMFGKNIDTLIDERNTRAAQNCRRAHNWNIIEKHGKIAIPSKGAGYKQGVK